MAATDKRPMADRRRPAPGRKRTPRPWRTALSVLLLSMILPGLAKAAPIPVNGIFEAAFTGAAHGNPYTDVDATVTFSGPGTTASIPAFWDGGTTWRVRFSPDQAGTWNYTVNAPGDGLLNGQSGSFQVDGTLVLKGGVRPMAGYPLHFSYQDGTPFFFWGDTLWPGYSDMAAESLNGATFDHYVDVRAAQGFNYVHTWAVYNPNSGGPPFSNLSSGILNPGFWQEMDRRVRYLNDSGITAGVMLAWASNGSNGMDWQDFPDDAARLRFAKYVTARYSADNVIFIVAGEWNEWGSRALFDQIGQTIRANDPQGRMIAIHATGSVEDWADTPWMGFGDYQQNYGGLHGDILIARDHNKPVVNSEYAYFLRDSNGDGVVDKPNSATLDEFRRATWEILMAGGYAVTGFGTTYFGGVRDAGPFDVDAAKNDPAEEDLTHARNFFTASRWWALQPHDGWVTGTGTRYSLADPGNQYLVYGYNTTNDLMLNLNTAVSNTYEVRRFDPRTGTWTQLADHTGTASIALTPPDTGDWAWLVTRTGLPTGAPFVSLAASSDFAQPNEAITFTPVATDPDGTIVSHIWHYGATDVPGSGSPGPSSYSFAQEGTYGVAVTVVDDAGNSATSEVLVITVATNRPPVITAATATPNLVVEGDTVAFSAAATDADGDALSYSWDIDGDGQPEYVGPNASHAFGAAGNYGVVLTVSDGSATVSQVVTVDVDPLDTTPPAPPQNVTVW